MEEKENKLGTQPVGKLLVQMSLPAITAQVINALYNIVDRIYIGHLPEVGSLALASLGVAFPLIMIISAFAALIGMGGAPRAAIALGAGKKEEAEKILGNCFSALVILSVVLTVLFLMTSETLLTWFGATENSLPMANSYFTIYVMGTISMQMALGLNSFISSQGFSTMSMMTVVIGAICNIVLDPILIYGFDMGVQGAAYTMLRQLNTEQVNLVTLEDPVEYHLDGISQVQINEKTGMTFASGLRAILRQDPDIISVSPTCKEYRPPKGSRGRSESPLVASAEAKSFAMRGEER